MIIYTVECLQRCRVEHTSWSSDDGLSSTASGSFRDVLGEGILDRSMTLLVVHSLVISPRMDQGLSEEGVENSSDSFFVL